MAQAKAGGEPELPVLPDEPVSRTFGFERGKPVDRWYIERFLAEHAADVRGRVLEVAESTYTGWYGGDDVTTSDVLYAAEGNPDATVVGDLTTGAGIPEAAYDCFICTQTLQFVYDVRAAVAGTRALLAPGGVLLATVPGISQISREDMRDWGDWWRFTARSAQRLFGEVYGEEQRRGAPARQRPGGGRLPVRAGGRGPRSERARGGGPRLSPADDRAGRASVDLSADAL